MNKLKELLLCSVITLAVVVTFHSVWDWVTIAHYQAALGMSVILSVILKGAISFEKVAAAYLLKQQTLPKLKRGIASYIILVGSKFLAMAVIGATFQQAIMFTGALNGLIAFFAVIFAVLGIESLVPKWQTSDLDEGTTRDAVVLK
ncbi:hypothetical protein [Motilimonas pumila]|uniref:Uncharacterized protein n=1 Tax=Motilimonas pumila TaxID=2303987 RepID=A0A418YBD0_9GAMM|nr:hypothetical protein [Motilimonas pumila]RJG40288.1 hypothetical protein D1Z90_16150 [Motilimonas pumila]